MRDVLQDLRYAARSLRRTPAFTAAAVITLALGIGANSAIFTLLDAVLFKPLALPHADELVLLYENPTGPGAPAGSPDTTGGTGRFLRFSYPRFVQLQRALADLGSLAAMTRSVPFAVRPANDSTQSVVRGQLVSENYFAVAGVGIAHGRMFTGDDVQRGASEPIVVVSDGFWKRVLGASASAVGSQIVINRLPVTVIGIAPPGFVGAWSDAESDLWMPLTMQTPLNYQNNASSLGPVAPERSWMEQNRIAWLNLFGRIPGPQRPRAQAVLRSVDHDSLVDLSLEIPDVRLRQSITSSLLMVEPFVNGFSGLRARFATSLIALAGMVAIVLLIACANIANLLFARSTARAREIGIRIALGASRVRLIQQGLTESVLLAAIGGAAGFAAGQWASAALARYALGSTNSPLPQVFTPDTRVLAFTMAASLGTALLFGLLPSIRATNVNVVGGLAGGRGVVSSSMIRRMRPLVTVQLALSFVVVFAAGLLGRTLVNFSRVNPGYDINRVVAASFNPRLSGYTNEQLPTLRERILRATQSVPGVVSSAISTCGLLANCTQSAGFTIGQRSGIQLNSSAVGAGYFTTVGIPLKSGREFTERDVEGAPPVAIVSESVARRYFPGTSPLGQRINDDVAAEVIGVVGDTRPLTLRDAPVPTVYFAIAQRNQPVYTLAARVTGDARIAAASIERAVKAMEPGLVLDTTSPMAVYVTQALGRERLVTYLVSSLGALALLLGCLGLYGVLSYAVARRQPEFGVRLALGAAPSELRRIVLRDGFVVVGAGTIVGLAAAFWANRLIQGLLFDVGIFDPLTCTIVIVLLAGSAFIACVVPAMRASRVDPIQALRSE